MNKNVVIVNGHPDPKSLCAQFCNVIKNRLEEKGAGHSVIELHSMEFAPFIKNRQERERTLEPSLLDAQQKIKDADHLIFVYPTWWGGMPSLLKSFFERTFTSGFAFKYESSKNLPTKLLKGKRADVLVTMDAPSWWYRFAQGAPGDKMIKNSILGFCGIAPVKIHHFDQVSRADEKKIKQWFEKVKLIAESVN